MKKLLVYGLITLMILCPAALVTGCGGSDSSTEETTVTEETITAADPQTPEEQEADDSDGCLEDSDDLLY